MKPPTFDYYDPATLEEALELMERYGSEAKVLAGGQSLMPLLNLRLARPSVLVDLNRIPGMDGVGREDGWLRVGALARQWDVEHAPEVVRHLPVLRETLRFVAHPQIRMRGTVGGPSPTRIPRRSCRRSWCVWTARLWLTAGAGCASSPPGSYS